MGIFERVRTALELPTVRLALLDLSKGKLTTDPARHTGGGVFFTSRAMALFALCANGLAYQRERVADGVQTLERIDDDADAVRTGTEVFLSLRRAATQTLRRAVSLHLQRRAGAFWGGERA